MFLRREGDNARVFRNPPGTVGFASLTRYCLFPPLPSLLGRRLLPDIGSILFATSRALISVDPPVLGDIMLSAVRRTRRLPAPKGRSEKKRTGASSNRSFFSSCLTSPQKCDSSKVLHCFREKRPSGFLFHPLQLPPLSFLPITPFTTVYPKTRIWTDKRGQSHGSGRYPHSKRELDDQSFMALLCFRALYPTLPGAEALGKKGINDCSCNIGVDDAADFIPAEKAMSERSPGGQFTVRDEKPAAVIRIFSVTSRTTSCISKGTTNESFRRCQKRFP